MTQTPVEAIDFYWRPGCGFCSRLRGKLDQAGLPVNEINIWEDPEAAAVVRSLADGNEVVPTVVVGNFGMVNPSAERVREAVAEHAPHLLEGLPEPKSGIWPFRR